MESGNGPPNQQQQQRYCPTPIMAPPSVAASPPLMSGGSVMNTLHQPTHHPPPSISPHPGAYYGHHTAGASHYPTPSPTPPPPPMHHQQYYGHAHSYYAHGSHQPQQQQSQQSQHHGIANTHVPMNNSPGTPQPTSQHSHLMGHGSYHHPQSQTHHQQWAAPTHPHQQQSHHYYHQPTHHSSSQQQQQPPQQHGYPPPPHSPYPPYVQSHVVPPPAPTPPPPSHTPHPPPQHLQQASQPQQHPQQTAQVSLSPGPVPQMHQAPPPQPQQQQPPSHALMNLSRFVSQQSPPSPSPRASPSHHPQQMSQMGPTSPLPYSGHLEHHPSMNGHSSNTGANNSPVMSPPPPAPVPNQQSMSPPSVIPVSQHHYPMPPQSPFSLNGGDMERHSPAAISNVGTVGSPDTQHVVEHEKVAGGINNSMKADSSSKQRREVPSVFANITPSKISSMLNSELKKVSNATAIDAQLNNSNSIISQSNTPSISDVVSSVSSGSESSFPMHSSNATIHDIPMDGFRSPERSNDFSDSNFGGSKRASCSPPSKPMGSPSSSGNGHQMMPVRLQNMHKGARTKANMKKLMQEQHITTPNGQVADLSAGSENAKAEVPETADVVAAADPTKKRESAAKSEKTSKRKRSQPVAPVIPDDSFLPLSPDNMDLMGNSTLSMDSTPRPGYTKAGKKIGRPKKDAMQTEQTNAEKPRSKKKSATPKKSKKGKVKEDELESPTAAVDTAAVEPVLDIPAPEPEINTPLVKETAKGKGKRKSVKSSRKRTVNLSSDAKDVSLPEPVAGVDLIAAPVLPIEPISASGVTPVKNASKKKGSKKNASKKANISITNTDSSPDSSILNTVPSSQIPTELAHSVAESIVQSTTPVSTAKGKKNARKSVTPARKVVTPRRSKSDTPKRKNGPAVVTKEVVVSPEIGGDLPRLRSRSPKQRDSPPLRISSPRAAKERSSTSAATPQTSSRSRASKEKETGVAGTVATPLSSPSLRTVTKSPEKEKMTVRGRNRQKAIEIPTSETVVEIPKDMLSPPPTKRSRQLSKESEPADAQRKGRRKPSANETRLSSDSDRSPSVGKRVSRRKSGSVSGSDILSSPSFNNHTSSSLSLIPSEGSLEMPSDLSVSTNADTSLLAIEQQELPVITSPVLPPTSRSRKGKKSGKGKGKAKRRTISIEAPAEILMEAEPEPIVLEAEIVQPVEPLPVTSNKVLGKARKARRAPAKKGKRKASTTTAVPVPVTPLETESLVVETESNENAVVQVENKVPALKLRNRKGVVKVKKSKGKVAVVVPPSTTAQVLNIPVPPPVLNVAKKNVKFKPAGKTRKQLKKSGAKKNAEVIDVESAQESIQISVEESHEEQKLDLNSIADASVSCISPVKRRRSSSSATAENAVVSAKSTTNSETGAFKKVKVQPTSSTSPTAIIKTLRRDSRSASSASVGKDNNNYHVSVVLTDIAQTFTATDSSLLGISNSLSRLQSPPSSTAFAAPTEDGSLSGVEVKEEIPLIAAPSEKVKSSTKKRQKLSEFKSEEEQPVKKKANKAVQRKNEIQRRAAQLEAEVAYALLDLKERSSSKSPSPAKSIQSPDWQQQSPKKKTKTEKRKSSKSPRRSIDSLSVTPASLESSVVTDMESSLQPPLLPIPKGIKRKAAKSRRNSKTKSKKSSSSLLSVTSISQNGDVPMKQELFPVAPHKSTVTAKLAVVPTSASLGVSDSPVVATKKTKTGKGTPKKGQLKMVMNSPDITQIPTTSAPATAPKQRRKKIKQEVVKVEAFTDESSNNVQAGPSVLKQEVFLGQNELPMNPPIPSSVEGSPKKKRQRKPKATPEIPSATVEPQPSTSAAALAEQLPTSSSVKLFPYQTSPTPYKKPTVFAKRGSFAPPAKEDDNQKKKQEAPSVRVLGGVAKFYRGDEVEEVDLDPRLPKDKGPLQTDNDVMWKCSFCHLGPHALKLGDLFGPYSARIPSRHGQPSSIREAWMHGDCALWAGRLILIGHSLRGLDKALTDADNETCTVCGQTGATIGCLQRHCKEGVHYPCAIRKFWKLDTQIFHAYCPQHIKNP